MKDQNARNIACTAFTMVFVSGAFANGYTLSDWQAWSAVIFPYFAAWFFLAVLDWMDGES